MHEYTRTEPSAAPLMASWPLPACCGAPLSAAPFVALPRKTIDLTPQRSKSPYSGNMSAQHDQLPHAFTFVPFARSVVPRVETYQRAMVPCHIMTLCCIWGDFEQCETSWLCATRSVSQRRHRQTAPLPWPACSAERGRLEVGSESQCSANV